MQGPRRRGSPDQEQGPLWLLLGCLPRGGNGERGASVRGCEASTGFCSFVLASTGFCSFVLASAGVCSFALASASFVLASAGVCSSWPPDAEGQAEELDDGAECAWREGSAARRSRRTRACAETAPDLEFCSLCCVSLEFGYLLPTLTFFNVVVAETFSLRDTQPFGHSYQK